MSSSVDRGSAKGSVTCLPCMSTRSQKRPPHITKAIQYPNGLSDAVIMIGFKAFDEVTFLIRPRYAGIYLFVLWPHDRPRSDYHWTRRLIFSEDVPDQVKYIPQEVLESGGCPPQLLEFSVNEAPRSLRRNELWQWALVPVSPDINSDPPMPPITDVISGRQASIAAGCVRIVDPAYLENVRKKVFFWSCHQPYRTQYGKAVLNKHAEEVLKWYSDEVEKFDPFIVWGMGDTAYADGTPGTDFAEPFYSSYRQWHDDPYAKAELREHYRRMFLYHWSFPNFQRVARNYPHMLLWDDHEIHDGYGSHNHDRDVPNHAALFDAAYDIAREFVFCSGPRLRKGNTDGHMATVMHPFALFGFDTRTSRNYVEYKLLSEQQKQDFEDFVDNKVIPDPKVKHFLISTSLPLVYLLPTIEYFGSRILSSLRDDIRDEWPTPNNAPTMEWLFGVLRRVQDARPDITHVNLSGDIHVANAFELHPKMLKFPLFQVTSSALTNRAHIPVQIRTFISVGKVTHYSDARTVSYRLWPDIGKPNFLLIEGDDDYCVLTLKVFNREDHRLVLSGGQKLEPPE